MFQFLLKKKKKYKSQKTNQIKQILKRIMKIEQKNIGNKYIYYFYYQERYIFKAGDKNRKWMGTDF